MSDDEAACAAVSDSEEVPEDDDSGDTGDDEEASAKAAPADNAGSSPDAEQRQIRRAANIAAMLGNRLALSRKPLVPSLYDVTEDAACLRRPFKSPHPGATGLSQALRRTALARRQVLPWGCKELPARPRPLAMDEPVKIVVEEELPPGVEPLVLWEPPEGSPGKPILVDNMLTRFLRPHQREGVRFLFGCVTGLRSSGKQGAILADDMGLGKTLQSIALLWTLLTSGHELLGGEPIAKRVIICCPTSLVSNWDSEIQKWLKGRLQTLPLCESSREDVMDSITQFLSPRNYAKVLIVSYETFRLHTDRFKSDTACDLLICDEAHRLKNDQTLTNKALDSLKCRRRILLSGTPVQNNLDEFYAMTSFCNPAVFGSSAQFRKYYERPILAGREPGATDNELQLAAERKAEMSKQCDEFVLRRTNDILSDHLPPKVIEVVCCKLTELQQNLYNHFLKSKATRKLVSGQKSAGVLSAITNLKKLCNHPKLIYDGMHHVDKEKGPPEGFEGCDQFFPPGLFDNGRVGRGNLAIGWELLSGKFGLMARMLANLRQETNDRIVIVSNYTQTLDLFSTLCRERQYPFVRLDGSTSITKRQKLVKNFCDPAQNQFVFLLSSKAGGCGLNLIGGNRLVLFDPDWNPATDKQAAARVWRDGQKKRVYVYRFITTGSIEEKVFQRQLSKEGLQAVVNGGEAEKGGGGWSSEDLRDLFTLRQDTASDTYDSRCKSPEPEDADDEQPEAHQLAVYQEQNGAPAEEDLKNWGHHPDVSTVPDEIMQKSAGDDVTFIFSCQVAGMKLEEEAAPQPKRNSAPLMAKRTGPVPGHLAAPLRNSAPASRVPGFAAPRAAQVQPEQQQPLLKAVKDRHSAPSPSPAAAVVPVTTDSLPMAEQSSAEPKSKKQQMRHSVPAAPRQPLACVSNNPPRTQQSKSASKRAARDSSTAGVQSLAKKQKSPAADIGDESGEETLITRKSRSSASAASSGNQSLVINSGSESEDDFQPAK